MVVKHRRPRDMPREEDQPETVIVTDTCCPIQNDVVSICLLMFLYVMQGIPLGLTAAVPYLLQSDKNTANYQTQATFSLSLWPFSLKLLWAPLVDSIYSSRFGRRKSWLIPVQYAIGIDLLILASRVDDWLGRDPDNPWGPLGVTNPVNIYSLTTAFFGLTLLAATQDIAVDGWALTMLSKRNVSWASTCNSVGQTLGYVIAFLLFLSLESPDMSNAYLRVTPVPGKGLITFSGFLYFWGIAFLVTTTIVAILKHEDRSTVTQSIQVCLNGVSDKVTTSNAIKRMKTKLKPLRFHRVRKSDPEIIPLDDETVTDVSTVAPDFDLISDGELTRSTSVIDNASDLTSDMSAFRSGNNVIPVYPNDSVVSVRLETETNEDLSLLDTYRVTLGVLMLKPILQYIAVLFLVKACFAASDTITTLKLIENGVSKERLAFLSMILLPLQAVLPLLITKWSNGPRPLGVYTVASLCRLIVSSLVIPLIYFTPYFAQPVPLSTSANASHTLNSSFTHPTEASQPQYTFSWQYYGMLLAYTAVYSVLANFMFVCQMAFHAKISDPAVGGTYMTLLNTAANMAAILPNTILLYLVDPLSIRHCANPDPLKAGIEAWHSSLGPNYTILEEAQTPPASSRLLRLGEQWLVHNATCKPKAGVLACQLAGGNCVTTLDGFYLEVGLCILVGIITFPVLVRPIAKRLDALSPSAYAYRLARSTICKGSRSCR